MNSTVTSEKNSPKISLGMPVYNGEKFLRTALDGILAQTFNDWELIISDNASTDTTPDICKEYAKKDNRIRYFRQEKTIMVHWNFMFVLDKANYEYFKWVAADDLYHPDFLKKNLDILESSKNIIGSISKIERFGPKWEKLKLDPHDSRSVRIQKKIKRMFITRLDIISFSGSFEKKVRLYMKKQTPIILYALFRTEVIRKSVVNVNFINSDTLMSLATLRHGDFYVLDEVMMYYYSGGTSSVGVMKSLYQNSGILGKIFPDYPLTYHLFKELGTKIFLQNLDYILFRNCAIEIWYIAELIHYVLKRIVLP